MCNGNMVRCPACKGERQVPCDSEECMRDHKCKECSGTGEVFVLHEGPEVLAGELEFSEPEGRG